MPDNSVTLVGNVTRDPELRFTASGPSHRHVRPRRQPSLPAQRPVGGADQLLQRDLLGTDGRERVAVAAEGRPCRRHRPPRAAVVGDPGRREALDDRRHRRRDRPEPALGDMRDHQERPPRARRGQWPAGDQRRACGRPVLRRRGTLLMAKKAPRTKNKDNARRSKKKTSVLVQESVEYIDYKDVNLLRRFMSDRAKIRARRVTGNDAQQQREVARAIKNAREMALLPYTNRVTTQRTSRDRGPGGPGRADGPPPRPAGPPPTSGGDGIGRRPARARDRACSTTCSSTTASKPVMTNEGDPARRRVRRRQEGRHRRRRGRLTPATTSCRRASPSAPPTATCSRRLRCVARATFVTPRIAARPRKWRACSFPRSSR